MIALRELLYELHRGSGAMVRVVVVTGSSTVQENEVELLFATTE